MKIATWNLERPRPTSWKKLPAARRKMAQVEADIWILTETRASLAPKEGFQALHSPPHPQRREDPDERWVSIWSRWPLDQVGPAPSPRGSIAARCTSDFGELIIYGCVLPWSFEPGDGPGKAKRWAVHYEEIERQGAEWASLRAAHPNAGLIVAGDFNQDMDGFNRSGTKYGRELLNKRLSAAGLVKSTAEDAVKSGRLKKHHLIDHICLSENWERKYRSEMTCWEPTDEQGTRMSDHPGVALTLKKRFE